MILFLFSFHAFAILSCLPSSSKIVKNPNPSQYAEIRIQVLQSN